MGYWSLQCQIHRQSQHRLCNIYCIGSLFWITSLWWRSWLITYERQIPELGSKPSKFIYDMSRPNVEWKMWSNMPDSSLHDNGWWIRCWSQLRWQVHDKSCLSCLRQRGFSSKRFHTVCRLELSYACDVGTDWGCYYDTRWNAIYLIWIDSLYWSDIFIVVPYWLRPILSTLFYLAVYIRLCLLNYILFDFFTYKLS